MAESGTMTLVEAVVGNIGRAIRERFGGEAGIDIDQVLAPSLAQMETP